MPFLVSLLLVALGTYVRLKVEESPSFKAAEQHRDIAKVPVVEVLTHYWRPTLVTFFICLAETSFFYLVAIFSLSYGTKTLGLPRSMMADGVLYANLLAMLTIPTFGMLSDKLGRRPMFLLGLAATAIFIYPFFLMMGSKETALVVLAIVIGAGLIHPMMFGPEGSFFSNCSIRAYASGVSLGKQIGTVLGRTRTDDRGESACLEPWPHLAGHRLLPRARRDGVDLDVPRPGDEGPGAVEAHDIETSMAFATRSGHQESQPRSRCEAGRFPSVRTRMRYRSSTSMGDRLREQHGRIWSLAARSSSVR